MSYKVLNIIKGTVYNILNLNEGLRASREDVACKNCFAASRDKEGNYSGWCSKAKNSCGCPNGSKTRVESEACPYGIWGSDWINLDKLEELNKEHGFIKKTGK